MGLWRVRIEQGRLFAVSPEAGHGLAFVIFDVERPFLFVFALVLLASRLLVGEGVIVGEGLSEFDSVVCH